MPYIIYIYIYIVNSISACPQHTKLVPHRKKWSPRVLMPTVDTFSRQPMGAVRKFKSRRKNVKRECTCLHQKY